jgi:hypothetical protein
MFWSLMIMTYFPRLNTFKGYCSVYSSLDGARSGRSYYKRKLLGEGGDPAELWDCITEHPRTREQALASAKLHLAQSIKNHNEALR